MCVKSLFILWGYMPESRLIRKYQASSYLLCVIVEGGHRRVFSPDFGIHFTVPISHDPHKWTAITLQQMEAEIATRLRKLEDKGEDHPVPLNWRTAVENENDLIGIAEASARFGISSATIRRAKDIPCHETPGGHRRYSVKELEKYFNTQ